MPVAVVVATLVTRGQDDPIAFDWSSCCRNRFRQQEFAPPSSQEAVDLRYEHVKVVAMVAGSPLAILLHAVAFATLPVPTLPVPLLAALAPPPPLAAFAPPLAACGPPLAAFAPLAAFGPPLAAFAPPLSAFAPPLAAFAPPLSAFAPPAAAVAPAALPRPIPRPPRPP